MDKETLSHYGWIVVMLLCLSLMILIATPFGKYVRTATWNYIVSFFDASDEAVDNIENNKEHNDINLNGSFIVTDRQGNPTCYVFGVNGSYDGYSLEGSGTAPNVEDRYFRCVRYANIEERRTIKEMFHLAAELGYDDTAEGRQGIQSALLHFVTGDDYGDYASNISSIARNVYDDLLAKSGSLDHEEYDYVKLVAIEKDGHIDMIIMSLTGNFDATYNPSNPKGWQVPKNGQYVMVSDNGGYRKTVYNEFEYLPYGYECQIGDTYTDDSYIFTYKTDEWKEMKMAQYGVVQYTTTEVKTWLPVVKDKIATQYPDMIGEINYTPIRLLDSTFEGCENMKVAPKLPDTVVGMYRTFKGCSNLTSITNIPSSTKDMRETFAGCKSLVVVDERFIPSTIIGLDETFINCTSLTTVCSMPDNIIALRNTFQGCTSLVKAPTLPQKLVYATGVFKNCSSLSDIGALQVPNTIFAFDEIFANCKNLTTAPVISHCSQLTSIVHLFDNCTSLRTYEGSIDADGDFSNYVIPTKTTYMSSTFKNCINLTIAPKLHNNITYLEDTFSGCTSLTTAPNLENMTSLEDIDGTFLGCTSLVTYHGSTDANGDFRNYIIPLKPRYTGATMSMVQTFHSCEGMIYAPAIPEGVNNLNGTFYGTGLVDEGLPVIPNGVTNLYDTFGYCDGLVDLGDYIIPEGVTNMSDTFSSCYSLEVAPAIPSTVTNVTQLFYDCRKLVDISKVVIPEGVTKMYNTFVNCESLTGSIIVNAQNVDTTNDWNYENFIKNTQITSIEGNCSDELKTILMETKNS